MGKTALVTGAAKGIGRAISLELAKHGFDIIINFFSSEAAANDLAAQVKEFGVESFVYRADVGKAEEAAAMFKAAISKFGRIDVLVNNAGITRDGLVMRMDESAFDDVIQSNLKSAFLCTKQAAAIMMKARSGRIINIASVSGITGNAGQANYSSSKAGMIGLTKSCARELAGRNITVNAIAPGLIESDMTAAMPESAMRALLDKVPLKRLGLDWEVAKLAAYLAGDDAGYITGQVICIDGGMAM